LTIVIWLVFLAPFLLLRNRATHISGLDEILGQGQPVVVEVFSNTWTPCLLAKPIVDGLERDLEGQAQVVRLSVLSKLEDGGALTVTLSDGEGGLLSIQEGQVQLDDREIGQGATILLPPAGGKRSLTVKAVGSARVLRAVHGRGHGLVRRADGSAARWWWFTQLDIIDRLGYDQVTTPPPLTATPPTTDLTLVLLPEMIVLLIVGPVELQSHKIRFRVTQTLSWIDHLWFRGSSTPSFVDATRFLLWIGKEYSSHPILRQEVCHENVHKNLLDGILTLRYSSDERVCYPQKTTGRLSWFHYQLIFSLT
jgi:hypothetical protein